MCGVVLNEVCLLAHHSTNPQKFHQEISETLHSVPASNAWTQDSSASRTVTAEMM